ncbi:serine/threonine protein kinase [Sandaracinus amylolyticus]|uniref:Serine/threonine protein kinase n=1 Tax=Sandaracinus amylolyticus TaxID=927083 RepID=A0A0F6W5K0_9BACT|nr:serine/threonine-protein kinase [Sandaracinus amylolyticus]AKF08043.1 serine/threonine protein kinase [Sandaracinus amylolyticus]
MAVDAPGRIIAGKYELVSPAGEGGMAVVWKALARGAGSFQRPVAIKRIQHAKHADPSFVRMFEEEARVGSELHHPNVVQILDFGMDEEGGYYLVMEWIEGLDMFQWVRSFPKGLRETPWPLVAAIGIEVCRALAAAHERVDARGQIVPVYHRDVSPSNVLLGVSGVVKLTDFGLARAMDRASMTRPNVIKGKLAYCAPELISGAKPSSQSDLFALGVVLWEALAQKRLFTGKNDLEVLLAVRKGDVPKLSELRPDVPYSLALAVHTALETHPDARFENAKSMARALAAVLRAEAEHADAEPLGASVRAARVRLGKDAPEGAPQPVLEVPTPKLGAPALTPVSEPSAQEISLTELEAVETPAVLPAESASMSVEKAPNKTVPGSPAVLSPAPRGLWQSDDRSVAEPLPLVKKK